MKDKDIKLIYFGKEWKKECKSNSKDSKFLSKSKGDSDKVVYLALNTVW